jgi:predicted nucleic acid-binding protein
LSKKKKAVAKRLKEGLVLDCSIVMQSLTAYDGAYLELALRRGLPIATLDDQLKAAAKNVGVSLYVAQ